MQKNVENEEINKCYIIVLYSVNIYEYRYFILYKILLNATSSRYASEEVDEISHKKSLPFTRILELLSPFNRVF